MDNLTPHDRIEQRRIEIEERANSDSLLCGVCIIDRHLWAWVEHAAIETTCTFCGIPGLCVAFEELAEPIEDALNSLYLTVEESGAFHEDGQWNMLIHDVGDILEYELLNDAIDDEAVLPLVDYVAGRNAVDHGFVRRGDVWASLYDFDEGAWRHFMARARDGDVIPAAGDLVAHLPGDVLDLFSRIERYAQLEGLYKSETPALWRGRPGKLGDNFGTGGEIGSAPATYAASGRLNARGQSVFYGATTLRGAAVEMANHHGPNVELWCGRFSTSRVLHHLDVMTAPEAPSPFAPGAADTFDAISFLIRFAETLREPKPDRREREEDEEYWARLDRHYRPTQIFTAFLLGAHKDLRPDAIKYGSSLDSTSENWVVFADHDHCTDAGDPKTSQDDDVFLLLDPQTVVFVAARDFLDGSPQTGRPST